MNGIKKGIAWYVTLFVLFVFVHPDDSPLDYVTTMGFMLLMLLASPILLLYLILFDFEICEKKTNTTKERK